MSRENVNATGLISTGFNDLGVPPLLGRGLQPSDAIDGQDPQPVALLGFKFWQKHFLSNPDVLGKMLQLDPIILLMGTALLAAVSGIAGAIPARYASRVDPMTALRYE